ncbi:Avirulence protein (Avh) [Phytophthora palmivora]|uniref:RxLR effector protein n=1 Tax=Phytophthora palmivora TaxID=4796 RepID=A0A2P4X0E1_9STRA|nr:Avirulence protein (Avh) [Phytophthora palmivora]
MRCAYVTLFVVYFFVATCSAVPTATDSERLSGVQQNDKTDFPSVVAVDEMSVTTKRSLRYTDTLVHDEYNTKNEERAVNIPGMSQLTTAAKKGASKTRRAFDRLQYKYWRMSGKTDENIYNIWVKQGKSIDEIYQMWLKVDKKPDEVYYMLKLNHYANPAAGDRFNTNIWLNYRNLFNDKHGISNY